MAYRAIDLFAGIGGIRLGFQQAFGINIEFVFSSEIDEKCKKTYYNNFNNIPSGDITKIKSEDIPDFHILCAGFPCQSFSKAGNERGFDDTRGTLFFEVARIIKDKKPIAFFLENVKNLVRHDNHQTFKRIIDILEGMGYFVRYKILDAKFFGCPQHRERVYIVGFKDNVDFSFPDGAEVTIKLKDILEKNVAEEFYISQKYLNSLREREGRHIQKGNGFRYTPLSEDDLAQTLVCGGMGQEMNLLKSLPSGNCWSEGKSLNLPNNEGLRFLTPREWARCQGFPDEYIMYPYKTIAYHQFANSVPVPVIKKIAEKMLQSLSSIHQSSSDTGLLQNFTVKVLMDLYLRKIFKTTLVDRAEISDRDLRVTITKICGGNYDSAVKFMTDTNIIVGNENGMIFFNPIFMNISMFLVKKKATELMNITEN